LSHFHVRVGELLEREQNHRILRGGARHAFLEFPDGSLQTGNHRRALARKTLTANDRRFLVAFGFLHLAGVGRFRQILRRFLGLLRSVFLVVRLHDGGVGLGARDQHVGDDVTEVLHRRLKFALHVAGDFRLAVLHLLERHGRNLGANRARHVRLDLTFRVLQLVERKLDGTVIFIDLVLHIGRDRDRRALVGVGQLGEFQLLHAQADRIRNAVDDGPLEVETRAGDANEFAEACDDALRLLLNGEQRAEEHGEGEGDAEYGEDGPAGDLREGVRIFHAVYPSLFQLKLVARVFAFCFGFEISRFYSGGELAATVFEWVEIIAGVENHNRATLRIEVDADDFERDFLRTGFGLPEHQETISRLGRRKECDREAAPVFLHATADDDSHGLLAFHDEAPADSQAGSEEFFHHIKIAADHVLIPFVLSVFRSDTAPALNRL
jgi:hypothetical protein